MNTSQEISQKTTARGPLLEKDHGYYNCQTILMDPEKVFKFCQDSHNVKKVLSDLPLNVENFLELSLVSAEQIESDQYKILWSNNKQSKVSGNVTFLLKKAPFDRGTFLSVEANFDKLNFNEDGPSTLINIFLKRFKALMETGEIPTTKGQPSGREELKTLH